MALLHDAVPQPLFSGIEYDGFLRHTNSDVRRQNLSDDKHSQIKCGIVIPPCKLVFLYGTLKKGFGNHWLMENLISNGHAQYVASACTKYRFPLVCGPFCIPFLLRIPASGHHVRGEVYRVDEIALEMLDDLEGLKKGHYIRCPLLVTKLDVDPQSDQFDPVIRCVGSVLAEAYFAASDYTPGMLRNPHVDCYTLELASSYIRRRDRPQDRTFLEHIREWIEDQKFGEGQNPQ